MKNFSPILAALLLGQTITAAPDFKASASATDNKLPALIYRSNAVYSILEAAKAGAPDVIEARLKEGDNVNQADEMGNTALHLAARAGSAECVKLLLNAGADTTLPDATGKLASQMATSKKISKMLKSAMAAREMLLEKELSTPYHSYSLLSYWSAIIRTFEPSIHYNKSILSDYN